MSLEAKIELLTAAVVELTRAFAESSKPILSEVTHFTREGGPSVAPQDDPTLKEIPNAEPETPTPTTNTSPGSLSESVPVTYDDVKQVTIAVSKIDKAKAVAGLARFGAKNAKELKEEQWRDYVAYMHLVETGNLDPESAHE